MQKETLKKIREIEKSGYAKKYALVGHPLGHSFSPEMHNAAFTKKNMDAQYFLLDIPEDDISEFFSTIYKYDIDGFNVTVPYKGKQELRVHEVIEGVGFVTLLDVVTIGACNTIIKKESSYDYANTDWRGFIQSVEEDLELSLAGKNVLLIGAGGAGKACVFGLEDQDVASIAICDINVTASEQLALLYADSLTHVSACDPARLRDTAFLSQFDLVVNASSCGMKPEHPDLIPAEAFPDKEMCVYDVIYNPAQTKLMRAAEQAGKKVSGGLGMLLYQGVRAFELWTGKKAPVAVMREALLNQLQQIQ